MRWSHGELISHMHENMQMIWGKFGRLKYDGIIPKIISKKKNVLLQQQSIKMGIGFDT